MIINTNLAALNTYRQLSINEKSTSNSLAKLSSGLRINTAADDAAGLAISEKMRGQISGLDKASSNAQNTISLVQTAEGALNETTSILQRMRELAVQSANDTNTSTDRSALQDEMNQLTSEIDRIANTTEFNTKKLLNGDLKGISGKIAGTGDLEATFANGDVTAKFATATSTSGVSLAGKTDVIRINVISTATISSGFSTATVSFSTVLGNISAGQVTKTSTGIKIVTKDVASTALTISIDLTGGTKINSGDTITISITGGANASTDSSKMLHAQIGANAGQELAIGIGQMDSTTLGVRSLGGAAIDIDDQAHASGAIKLIDNAIQKVSTERSKLGAYENRLTHTINNLGTSSENLTAAESRIRDVDMAQEMTNYQKNNILQQAAQAMLAQANQLPQGVLQLLK